MLDTLRRHRGGLVVSALCVVPAVLWVPAFPAASWQGTLALRTAGVVLGAVGFTAYALNIVLAARVKPVERAFGGLDRLYAVHRRLGTTVPLVLLAHAYLIVASMSAPDVLGAFGVLFGDLGWRVLLGFLALAVVVAGVVVSRRVAVAHESFVVVQKIIGGAFFAGAAHALLVGGAKALTPALRWWLVALTGLAAVAYAYRALLGRVAVPRRRYRVTAARPLAGGSVEISMAPVGRPVRHRAGQFAFFTFLGGGVRAEPHPFSIASGPAEDELRIVVKALGDFTQRLQSLEPGPEVLVEGPYGGFPDADPVGDRQVWVAGGIGITPFLSMARGLDGRDLEVDLYYCTETADEAHFADELYAIADANPRLRVIPVRRTSLGFVSAQDIEGASRHLGEKDVLICGPPAMLANLRRQLAKIGVPASRVHFEEFRFTG